MFAYRILAFCGVMASFGTLSPGGSAHPGLTAKPPWPARLNSSCPIPTPTRTEPPRQLDTPTVALQVLVPARVKADEELEYRIVVENRSTAAAHHVVIHDAVPVHARYVRANPEPAATEPELQWRLGTLEGGARREITLWLAPTGQGEIRNCVRVTFEHGLCVTTQVAAPSQPALELRKRGPAEAYLAETLTFQLLVTNTGAATVRNVVLTDNLPDGLEHASGEKQLNFQLGTLAPGQQRTVSYQVIAKAPGRHCNQGVVTADGGVRAEAEACVTVTEAKLSLTKTGPPQQYLNRPVTFRLTVSNQGTALLRNLVLTDRLPPQTTFLAASDGGRLVGSQVQWALGSLEPGASRSVELRFQPLSVGEIVNEAEATADRGVRATAEARCAILGAAALLLEVVDLEDPIEVGADTQYHIIVRNQGGIPATNVRVTATVPAELAIIRVQGPVDHRKDEQKVAYEPLNMPPNSDTIYRITVRAAKPGEVRFRVAVTADQLPAGPVLEEESTTLFTGSNGGR